MALVRSLHIAHESDPKEALTWFQRSIFSDIPPYFMTHWKTGKKFFYGGDALLAYEETPQHLIIAGEPLVAAGSSDEELRSSFIEFAKRKKKKLCGYYVSQKWNWSRFFKVPLGTSIRIPLQDFDIESPEAREVRRALRKGDKLGYQVTPVPHSQREKSDKLEALFKKWHRAKLPLHLKFFLSQPRLSPSVNDYEEWFVVETDGEPLAFCSLLPYLKEGELGFYIDHLIYDPKRDPHALSYLVSFLIETLKYEGVRELNLGLSPFAQMEGTSLMVRLFAALYHIPYFYRPKGLHFFKRKFTGVEEKEFCFFQSHQSRWSGLADMARVTLLGQGPIPGRFQ